MSGIAPGAWVYVGGDEASQRFTDHVGYARIRTVAAKKITFDGLAKEVTATDTGAGKTIRLFVGTIIKNERTPSLIKKKSYTIERSLGTTDVGNQAEYVKGAVPNELTLNVATADKVTVDLTFVGTNYEVRSGKAGDEKLGGTHIASLGEECFNTSSNIPATAVS